MLGVDASVEAHVRKDSREKLSVTVNIDRWVGEEGVIILGSLSFAAVLVFFVYRGQAKRLSNCRLNAYMGPGSWGSQESWTTNLTAVGAILGTVLAGDLFPRAGTQILSEQAYIILNLGAGAIIVIAALIYNSTRTEQSIHTDTPRSDNGQPTEALQYQGRVWAFLVAATMVVWAVTAELVTLSFLFYEIPSISNIAWFIFEVITVLALIFGLYYAKQAIRRTLTERFHEDKVALRKQHLYHKLHEKTMQRQMSVERLPDLRTLRPASPRWFLP
jgi:hypothetical protein